MSGISVNNGRLERDRSVGIYPLEAKKVCPHGEWSVFLEDAGIPPRTARRMLAFAMAGVQNGHVGFVKLIGLTPESR